MSRCFIAFAMWFLSVSALAAPTTEPWHADVYFLNSEARFGRISSQEVAARNSKIHFAVGARRSTTAILLEYALFNQTSGNATLSTSSDRREYMLWWKEHVYALSMADLFITGGVGASLEQVNTTLNGVTVNDTGESLFLGGAGAGISTLVSEHLIFSLEGRMMMGSNFDPNPAPGVLFRAGLEF